MRSRPHSRNPALRRILAVTATTALLSLALSGGASAYTEKTLHSFCAWSGCGDGFLPNGLLLDTSGNLYGTTQYGGKYSKGAIFKLVPSADKSKYSEHVLFSFCRTTNCPGGAQPWGDLIMDVEGNLYGTGSAGGHFGFGVVFKMTHGANGWKYTVLHSFCHEAHCTDGSTPTTGLAYRGQASGALWDESSPLFGTAYLGGTNNNGVAYEITTSGSAWAYRVIHKFNSSAGPNPLLIDTSGNLFGTTARGGKYGGGLLYKLIAGTWNTTVLHNFCDIAFCIDGSTPQGKLLIDAAGDLFGTTTIGGDGGNCTAREGCGVVFERPAGGSYAAIYNFCSLANCADGTNPYGGVSMDSSGNLFGATFNGGTDSYRGVAFELAPGGAQTVLYNFCPSGDPCTNGSSPYTPLLLDGEGGLFGATYHGGANGDYGTVFVLLP